MNTQEHYRKLQTNIYWFISLIALIVLDLVWTLFKTIE